MYFTTPICSVGQKVKIRDVFADGPATDQNDFGKIWLWHLCHGMI